MDTSQRMSFYRAQLRLGNLLLLCGTCNALKGALDLTTFLKIRSTNSVLRPVDNTNSSESAYASNS